MLTDNNKFTSNKSKCFFFQSIERIMCTSSQKQLRFKIVLPKSKESIKEHINHS
jgi:hypothetical protein